MEVVKREGESSKNGSDSSSEEIPEFDQNILGGYKLVL